MPDDRLYDAQPFEQIPGQTAFNWNDAPDTRDTRPVCRIVDIDTRVAEMEAQLAAYKARRA